VEKKIWQIRKSEKRRESHRRRNKRRNCRGKTEKHSVWASKTLNQDEGEEDWGNQIKEEAVLLFGDSGETDEAKIPKNKKRRASWVEVQKKSQDEMVFASPVGAARSTTRAGPTWDSKGEKRKRDRSLVAGRSSFPKEMGGKKKGGPRCDMLGKPNRKKAKEGGARSQQGGPLRAKWKGRRGTNLLLVPRRGAGGRSA